MKNVSQMIAAGSVATLFAGAALAGGLYSSDKQVVAPKDAFVNALSERDSEVHDAMKSPQRPWERGQVLALVQESKGGSMHSAAQPAMKQTWERGKLLNLLREPPQGVGVAPAEPVGNSPRVTIYFDHGASEPGLQPDLGNSHAGRSIMLRYLQQARNSDKSS